MTDQDKPFVCYKSGWNLKISPRNAAGWKALLLWMLALAVLTAPFVWLVARQPSDAQVAAYVTGYVLLTVGWSLAMLRWMYQNSEVIDLNELLKLKRELDARKKR
jgi:pheromone shutdown protein TraB